MFCCVSRDFGCGTVLVPLVGKQYVFKTLPKFSKIVTKVHIEFFPAQLSHYVTTYLPCMRELSGWNTNSSPPFDNGMKNLDCHIQQTMLDLRICSFSSRVARFSLRQPARFGIQFGQKNA